MGDRRTRGTLLLVVDELGDRLAEYAPATTVSSLIAALLETEASPARSLLVERTGLILDPSELVEQADLRSGDGVKVVMVDETTQFGTRPIPAVSATLHMLSGPMTGAAFELAIGTNTVGRVASNDVAILDPGISRSHATITVDEHGVTVADLGSTNGIRVEGHLLTGPARVESEQRLLLGQSWAAITYTGGTAAQTGGRLPDPRVGRAGRTPRRFEQQTVTLPTPPGWSGKRRAKDLLGGRNQQRLALEHFDATVEAVTHRLEEWQNAEVNTRRYEAPSVGEVFETVTAGPRMWERSVADVDGLEVRIGLADLPSRTTIEVPDGGPEELHARVVALHERFGTVRQVPAVVDLRDVGTLGIRGADELVRPLAYGLIGQLVGLHGPDQLGIACRPGARSPDWDWLKWLPHVDFAGTRAGASDADFVAWVSSLLDIQAMSPLNAASGGTSPAPIRPPAIVILIDDDGPMPVALLARLLQEGPPLGIYSIMIAGGQTELPLAPQATIYLDGGIADLVYSTGQRTAAVAVEPCDLQTITAYARTLAAYPSLLDSMASGGVDDGAVIDGAGDGAGAASDQLVSAVLFQLGGEGGADPNLSPYTEFAQTAELQLEEAGSPASGDGADLDPASAGEPAPPAQPAAMAPPTDGMAQPDQPLIPPPPAESPMPAQPAAGPAPDLSMLPPPPVPGPAPGSGEQAPPAAAALPTADPSGEPAAPIFQSGPDDAGQGPPGQVQGAPGGPDGPGPQPGPEPYEPIFPPDAPPAQPQQPAAGVPQPPSAPPGQAAGHGPPPNAPVPAEAQVPDLASRPGDSPDAPPGTGQPPATAAAQVDAGQQAPAAPAESGLGAPTAGVPAQVDAGQQAPATPAESELGAPTADVPAHGPQTPAAPTVPPGDTMAAAPATGVPEQQVPAPPQAPVQPTQPTAAPAKPPAEPEAPLELADLPHAKEDSRLILGTVAVADRPNSAYFAFNLPRDESLAVTGGGGVGKTTALRSVAAAAGMLRVPAELVPHIYYLDVQGGLEDLGRLPNVAGAARNDIDGFRAVVADVERLLAERQVGLEQTGTQTIEELRQQSPNLQLPRVLVLIDDIDAFRQLMEALNPGQVDELLGRLLRNGGRLGIHLVFSASAGTDLPEELVGSVGRWLKLGGQTSAGTPVPPGQAVVGKGSVRFATFGGADREQAMARLWQSLTERGVVATTRTEPADSAP